MKRILAFLEQHLEIWLLPAVLITAWFYYPYCKHGPVLCLARLLLHRSCPGCGLTRAICFIVHGKLKEGFQFNPLSVVFLFLMTINFVKGIWNLQWRTLGGLALSNVSQH